MTMPASTYVVEMTFDTDARASGLAKANAWITLQGDSVEVQTIVGDWSSVSIYYTAKVDPPKRVTLDTGSLSTVSPNTYTFTNGTTA
jgi:hypothetical protein